MYVESLNFETKSLISEASDSGMGTEGAPSEFDVDIGGQYRKVKITILTFCNNNNHSNNYLFLRLVGSCYNNKT